MNDQGLRERLAIDQGALTISQSTLSSASVSQLLAACYGDQPIAISGARQEPGEGGVSLSGRSSFLGVADLPLSARFEVDAQGEVHAILRYQLRGAAPGPDAWTFSRSFPGLPPVLDYATGLTPRFREEKYSPLANQRPFLDALDLFDTWFVVSTHDGADPVTGLPLSAGINFASQLRPQGMVGVLEHALSSASPVLTLRGTVRLPRPTDRTLELRPLERVWDRPDLAGIHLQAALGMDFQLGGLTFRDARFRIYSPPSQAWMEQNPFQPAHGYSGTLSIPSAGIEVKLGADLKWNLPEALLHGDCQGLSLGKLTQLLDLTGSDGLSSSLPEDLRKAVDGAGRLELMQVALQVGLDGLTPTVRSAYCTVGVPDLRWKVWGDHLVVEELACRFAVVSPAAAATPSAAAGATVAGLPKLAPPISAAVYGTLEIEGVPLDVFATSDDGFTIRAGTGEAVKLPVDRLVKSLAPQVTPPSALAVDSLGVSVAFGRSYEMTALLAAAPDPWVIPVGKVPLTVSDVVLSLQCAQGKDATGTFAGKIAFTDQVVLEAAYSSPGDFAVRSTFHRISLMELVRRLCDARPASPGEFDLVIDSASILIEKRGDSATFLVMGAVQGFGLLALEVRKVPAQGWGFAVGVDLSGGKLSRLPGLSALKAFEDFCRLDKLMLVLSTFEDASFQLPSLAKFNRPDLGVKGPARPAPGVIQGLMVFAEWQLRADDRRESLLKKLLGLGATQSAALAISSNPASSSRLYVDSRSTIQGHPFVCRFGIELSGGVPTLFMTGTITVGVLGHPQTFSVTGVFAPGGLLIAAELKGSTSVDLKLFKLSNLALQVGVNWAGVPSLGVAATIDVKTFESSVAVFFDSTNPAKSLVAGSVSALSLKDVMDTFLGTRVDTPLDEVLKGVSLRGTHQFSVPGSLAADLDGLVFEKVSAAFASAAKVAIPSDASQLLLVVNKPGSAWHLTDLTRMRHYQLRGKGGQIEVSIAPQFYFAPAPTAIGTTRYPQGFYVNGALNFAGFEVEATVDISAGRGVSVEARMDRIAIGSPGLFSIEADQGGGGPAVSISTFSQPDHPVKEFRLPHFYVNGKVSLLGVKAKVFASLTIQGLVFELSGPLAPAVHFNLQATIGSQGLDVGGKVKIGVGTIDLGALGKLKLDTDLEGQLGIAANAKKIEAWVEASFKLMGKDFHLGRAKLDTSPDALARLAETMAKRVEAELRDYFKDAGQWANAVQSGVVEGVEDTTKDVGKAISKGTKSVTKSAKKTLKKIF